MKKKSPEKQVDITNRALSEITRQSLAMDYSRNDMADAYAMISQSMRVPASLWGEGTTSTASDVGTTLTVDMLRDAATALRNMEPPQHEDNGLWGGYGREVDLRPGAVSYIRGMIDYVTMNGMGGQAERPSVIEVYPERQAMKSACGKFVAESLYTNQRLWDESEAMRNCVYRSYRSRVKEGGYALYHIDAPHLGKRSGFTVGYKSETREERCPDRDVWIVRKRWVVDQIKGKANSQCTDRQLQDFCDWIAVELGETREEVRREVERKSWWGRRGVNIMPDWAEV